MTQPVSAARGTATHHFGRDSLEAVRPSAAGPDVHGMQSTPAIPRPLRAAPS